MCADHCEQDLVINIGQMSVMCDRLRGANPHVKAQHPPRQAEGPSDDDANHLDTSSA